MQAFLPSFFCIFSSLTKFFWKKLPVIICLRDKYVAHRDRNWKKHNWNSSDFKNALKIAIAYECWVNDLLQKEGSPSINSLADIIKSAKGEIMHVTALLSSQKR